MPRTRSDLDRDQKIAELVDAAVERLRSGGYEALSVAAIARERGLAQNAVYWYFPTRDHLFVAAVDKILDRILSDEQRRASGRVVDHVISFVERLEGSHGVIASLYVRARVSPVVAEYEACLRPRLRALMAQAIAPQVEPPEDVEEVACTLLCTIEGALLLGLGARERDRVIRRAFAHLIG